MVPFDHCKNHLNMAQGKKITCFLNQKEMYGLNVGLSSDSTISQNLSVCDAITLEPSDFDEIL